jgi:hypothetical protein
MKMTMTTKSKYKMVRAAHADIEKNISRFLDNNLDNRSKLGKQMSMRECISSKYVFMYCSVLQIT